MKLLDYNIKTSSIDNGKGYWNSTKVEIYKGEEKIGEFIRTYPSFAKETFFAFKYKGKEYAFYSDNYTKIKVMSLPNCKEIELKEECIKQMEHFCPTEIYVPIYGKDGDFYYHQPPNGKFDDKDEFNYANIAFALGCIWGDDSCWKLMIIDFKHIEEGELWFVNNKLEKKWLYEDFPDQMKLSDIEIYYEENDETVSGYKQPIQKYIYF